MAAIIKFAYTGEIILTEENAISLTKDADYFGFVGLKHAGLEFLKSCLDVQNVYEVHCFAESLGCTPLSQDCKKFMLQHFQDVSLTDDYLNFDFKLLSDLLSDAEIQVSSEIMFKAVMKWILNAADQRKVYLSKLLGLVRLSSLDSNFLTKYLFQDRLTSLASKHGDVAVDIMFLYENSKQNSVRNEGNIIAMNYSAAINYVENNIIEIYNPDADTWESITGHNKMDSDGTATVHKDKVYRFGNYPKVYDASNKVWRTLSKMNNTHSCGGAAALNGFLYVCGGLVNCDYSNIVERYCPESNEWQTMSPMNHRRACLAAIGFQGFIYAIGGQCSSQRLDTIERYDPEKNQWTMLDSKMNEERSNFGAAVLNGQLYVCGGFDGNLRLDSVEVYDPETNVWEYVASMSTARSGLLVVASMGKLWAIGGLEQYGTSLSTVEVYDPDINSWSYAKPMNKLNGCIVGGRLSNC